MPNIYKSLVLISGNTNKKDNNLYNDNMCAILWKIKWHKESKQPTQVSLTTLFYNFHHFIALIGLLLFYAIPELEWWPIWSQSISKRMRSWWWALGQDETILSANIFLKPDMNTLGTKNSMVSAGRLSLQIGGFVCVRQILYYWTTSSTIFAFVF